MKLNHLVIIPDGNRRWAKKHFKEASLGHEEGSLQFEKIYKKIVEIKIPYFSFWGASYDNLTKRSPLETENLLNIFHKQFERLLNDERIMKESINVNFIGRWQEVFKKETQEIIFKIIEKTKNNKKLVLTFLLAYNGTDEMIDAIKTIKEKDLEVNEKNIKESLWTKNLPPVDLIIRTGAGEDPHNSAGFMMWDTAYSQLHFTETLFPEFKEAELEKIINNFNLRERRHGK